MKAKKVISKVLAAALASAMLLSCVYAASPDRTMSSAAQSNGNFSASATTNGKKPKYVFLFIGDGMSYPQFQAASDYLGAVADTDNDDILDGNVPLSFMNFPVAGSAVTYDSTSFCPDSASTATSISTGHKTYSGTINMDETGSVSYETISEKLKAQNKPYAVSLSPKPASIQGGMILAEGNIETNLSYEILIKNMRDELEAEVAKVLTE